MSDEMRNIMGPADGQQKMRLMAHLYENTTPIKDRRERYGQALAEDYGDSWECLTADEREVWCGAGEAAMAVADEERYEEREEFTEAAQHAIYQREEDADRTAALRDENTRLRAEQREYDERFEAQNAEITRLRAELERERQRTQEWIDHSEKLTMTACGHVDTISRVRAACDREESRMIDPDKASIRTSVIRAALDDPNG